MSAGGEGLQAILDLSERVEPGPLRSHHGRFVRQIALGHAVLGRTKNTITRATGGFSQHGDG